MKGLFFLMHLLEYIVLHFQLLFSSVPLRGTFLAGGYEFAKCLSFLSGLL